MADWRLVVPRQVKYMAAASILIITLWGESRTEVRQWEGTKHNTVVDGYWAN